MHLFSTQRQRSWAGLRAGLVTGIVLCWLQIAVAGPLPGGLIERRAAPQQNEMTEMVEEGSASGSASLPAGARLLRDVAYGADRAQRMDVYLPRQAVGAPVILMVHGGAWRLGDKAAKAVVENKVARWVPKGFVFISVNYRLQSHITPLQQAEDVARALAVAQGKAAAWGSHPEKFVLMGHSAGAHLVALLAAAPQEARKFGAAPWLGTVALDSAALDVAQIMGGRHAGFYDRVFGSDAAFWSAASPYHQLSAGAMPVLAVCSSKRSDSCPQARRFVARAALLGVRAEALPRPLSHAEINQKLGLEESYTAAVESFMGSLDPTLMRALTGR